MLGLVALAAVPAAGVIGQRRAEARDRARYPMPGRLVDVDGAPVHVVVEGSGPTVLVDSGLGGSCLEWGPVAAALRDDFTVVRYDRPGFGWSPAQQVDPSPVAAARRIQALLTELKVPLPAVLVGHSLGGLHVRVAAVLHPETVRGLVLVDPSDEHMLDEADDARQAAIAVKVMSALAVTARLGTPRLLGRVTGRMVAKQVRGTLDVTGNDALRCATRLNACSVGGMRAAVAEMTALPATLRHVDAIVSQHALPDIPFTVISADASPRTDKERLARTKIRALHEALAASTPRGRLVLAADSGHLVPLDAPDLIAACIRELR